MVDPYDKVPMGWPQSPDLSEQHLIKAHKLRYLLCPPTCFGLGYCQEFSHLISLIKVFSHTPEATCLTCPKTHGTGNFLFVFAFLGH